MRAVVTGGGTGGHIYPAIAVCEAIKAADPGGDLLYIGGRSGMETSIVPDAGIPFQAVTARKMPMSLSIATLKGLIALAQGYFEAKKLLKVFNADVLVGTGGYVAAAAALAAAHLKKPVIILENNRVAGRTNLMLASKASSICVSFQETIKEFPEGKCVLTGLPLRQGVIAGESVTPAKARAAFNGLNPDLFTVAVIGGSQGARNVNRLIAAAAPRLAAAGIQLLHQTGKANYEETARITAEALRAAGLKPDDVPICQQAYLDAHEMPLCLRAADFLVCRGGISTLSEAAANGLPMLVIPLPTAYADHQTANARGLEEAGAAYCVPEAGLTGEMLADRIIQLKSDPVALNKMRAASCGAGRPAAAAEVARLALKLGKAE
jgi:UDP-N-acetylglucosamine--N-acetylmuramyl-(pentapeptide) pyrophosphoryl-undecaprenol N-acetylglucosamine transferase